MPVLMFLIVVGAALLWLLLSFAFKPVGRFAARLVSDAKRAMTEETEDNKKELDE